VAEGTATREPTPSNRPRLAEAIIIATYTSVEDVTLLEEELAQRLAVGQPMPALVLKIETRRAVLHLPQIIVRAVGHQPTVAMLARGDLAVALGYERTAEMQEEILWLCEAAHVPVIWATQVLGEELFATEAVEG
jgi:pyruvate kinase